MPRTGRPRKPRVTVQCEHCGKDIQKLQSDVDRSKTGVFFCDRACMDAFGGSKPRRGTTTPCDGPSCREDVYRSSSYDKDVRFCSKECYDAWQARGRTDRVCAGCEETFALPPSEPDIYCSRKCYDRARFEESLNTRRRASDGYIRVRVPDHPHADALGRVAEHRLVMEEHIGRHLLPHEQVHHVDGDRANNDLTNLELWSVSHPSGARVTDQAAWVEEFLRLYPEETLARLRG